RLRIRSEGATSRLLSWGRLRRRDGRHGTPGALSAPAAQHKCTGASQSRGQAAGARPRHLPQRRLSSTPDGSQVDGAGRGVDDWAALLSDGTLLGMETIRTYRRSEQGTV